jgi:DNA-binding XRE family transcriptional regulator
MSDKNYIKEFRLKIGGSQKSLADAVGISQQHLQRLESGKSPVRLVTADEICRTMKVPLRKVFPALAKVLTSYPGNRLRTAAGRKELTEAGADLQDLTRTFLLGVSSSPSEQFTLSAPEGEKLEALLNGFGDEYGDKDGCTSPFFKFDTGMYAVCVNLKELAHARQLSNKPTPEVEAMLLQESNPETAPHIKVWLHGRSEPLQFSAAPEDIGAQAHPRETGQFTLLLRLLEGQDIDNNEFSSFWDVDGLEVFFRTELIAMIAIPNWLLRPEMDRLCDEVAENEREKRKLPRIVV